MSAIKSFNLINGGWSFLNTGDKKESVYWLNERLDIQNRFFETNIILVTWILFFAFLWIFFLIYKNVTKNK